MAVKRSNCQSLSARSADIFDIISGFRFEFRLWLSRKRVNCLLTSVVFPSGKFVSDVRNDPMHL